MALLESFDDVAVPINATISGGPSADTVTEAQFIFSVKKGTTTSEQAPVTAPVASAKATTSFGPTAVDDANDFYEVSYKVKITPAGQSATTLDGEDTIKVWPKTIKVKLTSDNGEDHKNAKFRIMRDATKLAEPSTNDKGEWEGNITYGSWTVEVAAPWEKKADTKATGRSREFKVAKQPAEAKFISPDPDNPAEKIKQFVNLDTPSTGWAKATPYGNQVVFKVGTKNDLGTAGTIINIKCEFGRESARDTPKPALLADGLSEAPTEENSGKTWKGKIALGSDKTATFKVELGYAGGDTVKVKIGTTAACEDATLEFENWRRLWYENWMPKPSELSSYTNFAGATNAALATNTTNYLKEVLDQVCIEWAIKGKDFFDKSALTDLEQNAYPASLWGGPDTNQCLVLTMPQIQAILNTKAVHKADKRVVSMIWCDILVNEVKAWNQTFSDIEGEKDDIAPADNLNALPTKPAKDTGYPGGDFAIERVSWRATHWQDGSTWKPIAADTDPGGKYRTVDASRTLSSRADVEAHIVIKRTTKVSIRLPAGTDTDTGYPAQCLGLSSAGKLEAPGLTASSRPTVEFAPDVAADRSDDNNHATIQVKEVNQDKTHDISFAKPGALSHVGTDVTTAEQGKLDAWIRDSLCGFDDLKGADNKLRFELTGPSDNDRRRTRIANVKTALTARVGAVAPLQAFPTAVKPVRIEFLLQGSAAKCNINGAAQGGNIWMCTFNGNVNAVGMGGVLLHELGHNMGQAYANRTVGLDTSDNVNFGRQDAGKIPGIDFPAGVPGGDIYAGKGHRGTHCAHGVADKTLADYNSATGNDCLMFGSANMNSATKIYFCDNCKKYIKAENLSDIRKTWNA